MMRRFVSLALLALGPVGAPLAHAQPLAAPNVVAISPRLVTAGQPTEQALAELAAQGFRAVVYLAPATVPDAVRREPELLAAQGVEFIPIPIPFGAPAEAHFEAVSTTLQRLQDRKVLVHCQVNMRASVLVFLDRVIRGKEAPAPAWEAVSQVWTPEGPWKRLVVSQLAKHGVAFDPF